MAMAAFAHRHHDASFGATLERRRLEFRARRLEQVVTALQHRELRHRHDGHVPVPLAHAIAGFSSEMAAVRHRLRTLES
jgi:hypothetical protein